MSKTNNLASHNYTTRDPELFASLEVLWGGLGDLVQETAGGSYGSVLDYFSIGKMTCSQRDEERGHALTFDRTGFLACWVSPEKSNGVILGHNRNYALRVLDSYTFRGGPTGDILSATKVATEILVGRWSTNCAVQIDDEAVYEEEQLPDLSEMQDDIKLNTVLDRCRKRFEQKKLSYQTFRDNARDLQSVDMNDVMTENDRNTLGDVCYGGQRISTIVDDIRRSANSSNNTRLTLLSDRTLWSRIGKESKIAPTTSAQDSDS